MLFFDKYMLDRYIRCVCIFLFDIYSKLQSWDNNLKSVFVDGVSCRHVRSTALSLDSMCLLHRKFFLFMSTFQCPFLCVKYLHTRNLESFLYKMYLCHCFILIDFTWNKPCIIIVRYQEMLYFKTVHHPRDWRGWPGVK